MTDVSKQLKKINLNLTNKNRKAEFYSGNYTNVLSSQHNVHYVKDVVKTSKCRLFRAIKNTLMYFTNSTLVNDFNIYQTM
jgi:hypothetical protein